jgi:uncharacterized cupin superfamily protein
VTIAHWDEVEPYHRAKGEMDGQWQRLGDAAGARGVGVNRVRIEPGKLSTPPHSHGASEEIFFVLAGTGLSWQDERVCEVRAGDCIVHLADHEEHTLRAGDAGLEVLVFGTRHPTELGWLPRSQAIRFGWPWVQGRTDDPWDVESESPPLEFAAPAARPANVVNVDDVARDEDDEPDTSWKGLGETAGSVQAGLNWIRLPPERAYAPPHCHSEEEEVFAVLEGDGTLELWPSPRAAQGGAEREDIAVRAGHVIARPPATRIGHALRAGAGGMTHLAYGTRRPNDICYYPRSNKISWRGVGVIGRIEHLDYWDGEPRG